MLFTTYCRIRRISLPNGPKYSHMLRYAFSGRPFVKLFDLCHRTVVCLSVYNVGVLWPNGRMDQDATWYRGRPRPGPHCVRWRPSSPHGKGHSSPPFSAHVYCDQTVAYLSNCWALVGNSKQLQQHDSVHLSSVYTNYSFSSVIIIIIIRPTHKIVRRG